MPYQFKIFNDEKIIVKKFRGTIDLIEFQQIIIRTMQLNDQYPDFRILNDFRFSKIDIEKREFMTFLNGIHIKNVPSQTKGFIIEREETKKLYLIYIKKFNFTNALTFDTVKAAANYFNIDEKLITDFLS